MLRITFPFLFLCIAPYPISDAAAAPAPFPRKISPVEDILATLRANARRADGMIRAGFDLDAKCARHSIRLRGNLAFDSSGRFRIQAKVLGQRVADGGHNGGQSWWIWRGEKVAWPLPIEPHQFTLLFGIGKFASVREYKIRRVDDAMELSRSVGDGRHVIVVKGKGKQSQITGHRLEDRAGNTLCSVAVTRFDRERKSGLELPTRFSISWPARDLKMDFIIDALEITPLDRQLADRMFQSPR